VTEEFDLSAYDGQTVLIAFRSMTDWASNGNGALTPSGWYVRNIDVAGTTYDGSSTEPFMSLAEVRQDFVDYQFTVIGVAGSGRYEVLQYDARTFDSGDAQELAEFFEGDDAGRGPAFDQVIFTVTYAPAPGQTGAVPYEVGVNYYEAGPHKAPGQPGSSAAGEKAEK
jgi:immune inhibitor A